jgi:hypothetical protein
VEICTVGSVRGESVGAAMVDLNGHEAGNGRYSPGRPTARRVLLYSERCPVTRRNIKGRPFGSRVLSVRLEPLQKGTPCL